MKKALITGITGQDGSYLAELLLEKGYEVHGIVRRSSSLNRARIDHLHPTEEYEKIKIFLHYGDLSDGSLITKLVHEIEPDEIYNLGAQSHVGISFLKPAYTCDIDALSTIRLLEAIRSSKKKIKYYQASSSEMFGSSPAPQNEKTPFMPRSPYACAKLFSYWTVKNYREAYGIFATNGILFNHESPRRGENFVTKKITRNLCEIKEGIRETLTLGNLDAKRDWGYAKDYVEAMWMMLQQEIPDDFVISTGETRTVKEFVETAARELGFDLYWEGYGVNEVGIDKNSRKTIVKLHQRYFRPTDVSLLLGDSTKAKEVLKWAPKTSFQELVKMMVNEDLIQVKAHKSALKVLRSNGHLQT